MDNDLEYPNPVKRRDLPRRVHWRRRIFRLALLLLGLAIAFLPQILSTRLGAKMLAAYLQRGCGGAVSVQTFSTHWFGPTKIEQLWIVDPRGRKVGFVRLQSEISLLQLLRKHYDFGKAELEQPYVDYVLDYGDGTDTMDEFWPGKTFFASGTNHPHFSGTIAIHRGTVMLWRGHIEQNLVDTTYSAIQIANVEGNVEASSLDVPATFNLTANPGKEFHPDGALDASGQFCFGSAGQWSTDHASIDALANLQKFPGESLAVLFPQFTAIEWQKMTGGEIQSATLKMAGVHGMLSVQANAASLDSVASLNLSESTPGIPQTSVPPLGILQGGPTKIDFAVPGSVARRMLSRVNPFFIDAADTEGARATITLDGYSLGPKLFYSSGKLSVTNLPLVRDDGTGGMPTNLTARAAILVGDSNLAPVAEMHDGVFKTEIDKTIVGPLTMNFDKNVLSLRGQTSSGNLQLAVAPTTAPNLAAALPVAASGKPFLLTGSWLAPRLELTSKDLSPTDQLTLDDFVKRQLDAVRATRAQIAAREQEEAVQAKLRELSPSSTQP